MRRLLIVLAVAVALLVGPTASQADAHFMPEGAITWEPLPNGCLLESTYGNYGGNGLAQITLRPGLSSACSLNTAVEVTVAINGEVRSQYCTLTGAIDNPSPNCVLSISPVISLRAVRRGAAFAMRVVAINLNGFRYETTHGAFG